MSVTAKCLAQSKAISPSNANQNTAVYTCPANTTAIVDKCVAFNGDSSSGTLTVYIVPSGSSAAASTKLFIQSISSNATQDFSAIQNQILNAGDSLVASSTSIGLINMRMSGREIT